MGISYLEYLANPEYRKFPFKGLIGWSLANRPPSVEDLQSKYEFRYYSTMNKAVTDVNNGTTANADATKDSAVAGVYTDENGGANVVLLKDHTEAARIKPSVDMTINLGGHTLSTNDTIAIDSISGNVTIDGRLNGSSIEVTRTDGQMARPLQIRSGNFVVNGGTYIGDSQGAASDCVFGAGNISINNARIVANATSGKIAGLSIVSGGVLNISNCIVDVASYAGATGVNVYNGATAVISNCSIRAYSDYTYGETSDYEAISHGIYNLGSVSMNNCHVMGTHSGIQNNGTITVNGGTYEGYGHGGFYFSSTGTTSYVRDAIIRDCNMPDGYTATANRNGAGFYLGDATNVTVYMDNCDIYGISATQTFVIKTNDNTLLISNSTINNQNGGAANVRIDSGNTLYLGRGNNFTAENTSLPDAVVVTDEVYREVA